MKLLYCAGVLLFLVASDAVRTGIHQGLLRATPMTSKAGQAAPKIPNSTRAPELDLPVRPLHLKLEMFTGRKAPAKQADAKKENATNVTEAPKDVNARLKAAAVYGQSAPHPPTTPSIERKWAKFQAAWKQYEDAHGDQPIIAECASMIATCRGEFERSHCSIEFHEQLELAERAETYCRWFNPEYGTTVRALEKKGDSWCGRAQCESANERLAMIEVELVEVIQEAKMEEKELEYREAQRLLRKHSPQWEQDGCVPTVCQTLTTQAARIAEAKVAYAKLGSQYKNYISLLTMEGLVVYDLATILKC